MYAHDWFLFFEWFDELPTAHVVFADSANQPELEVVTKSMTLHLNKGKDLKLVERFDWLSEEMLQMVNNAKARSEEARDAERDNILRAATARRLADSEKHGPLFRSRRAKWEHETELSRLARQTEELEHAHSERLMRNEHARQQRQEFFQTMEKLPYGNQIRVCSAGTFRLTPSGELIWNKLKQVGRAQAQGWTLSEILTMGHLLAHRGSKS